MERAYYTFKPKDFKSLPEGTILRYLAHDFKIDTQEYTVVMEVLGVPPKGIELPNIQFA
jgi:hypothetical protein